MKPLIVFHHQNVAVFLTDRHMFMADGYEGVKYDTAEGIKSYIDRTLKAKAKLAKPDMLLEVCDEQCKPIVVVGLNAGTCHPLTQPKMDSPSFARLYPFNENVIELLAKRRVTQEKLQRIENALLKVKLDASGWSSLDGDGDDRLAKAYARVQTDYDAKMALCAKLPDFLKTL